MQHGPYGLFPHDLAREVIDADLRWRDPAAHRQVHLRVRRHVVTRIWGSEGRQRERALAILMFLQGAVLLGTGALPAVGGMRWHGSGAPRTPASCSWPRPIGAAFA
jgi:hypothetical protein